MAKFYATFGGENGTFNGVGFYDKLTVTDNRTSLIAARDALSAEFYGTIDAANQNGTLGVVIPRNGFIGSAGGYGGPTLYTYDITKWNADPTVRPIVEPTTTGYLGSTPGTITDAWAIGTTNYNSATSLVSSTILSISGTSVGGVSISNGPFGRLGPDPYRTLASLHYDSAFTYFAWNDFLPGRVKNLAIAPDGQLVTNPTITREVSPSNIPIEIYFDSTDFQFKNDAAGSIRFTATLNSGSYSLDTGTFAVGTNNSGTGWSWDASTYKLTWTVNLAYGTYTGLSANVFLYDDTTGTSGGTGPVNPPTGATGFVFEFGSGS